MVQYRDYVEDECGVRYSDDGKTLLGVRSGALLCEHYNIHDGVKTIEANAFLNCQSLKSVYMPDSVSNDGGSIFEGCLNMKRVRVSACMKHPNIAMFCGCSSLCEVELPEGVESIGDNMFCGCESLGQIVLPSTLKYMGDDTFCGSGIEKIIMPESLTNIGSDTFINCYQLKQLVIPSKVKEIGPWLVQGHLNFDGIICKSDKFRIENDSLISNNDNSLIACWTKMAKYHLPVGVKNIRSVCNDQIEVLFIDHSLEEIDYDAFVCCPRLKEIVYNSTVRKNKSSTWK